MQTLSQLPPVRPDTLRWAIFLAVLGPSAALAQTGLEAASGPGGTPVIHNGHGVPVIDIVPPNATGLSHNQFIDYNVATPGLVLNNATAAGQSQLAGALAANPQFQGQAASTILNEVVSRNASLIEGPQEIFGRPADYILANPNGITLNGGSFINTTRAGFVVGTPQFEEQQLRYLDTLTASGTLQVLEHGQGNAGGALELIAPRVDSKGLLMASETLDITVGRNRIDSRSGEVVEHLPSPSSSIDASLFGAMRAGRIRVVSTAEGAGVRVGASQILGTEGVDISSAGGLHVSGSGDRPTELRSERGVLKLTAADDLMLETVDGQALRIEARAGKKLTLDAKTIEHIKHDSDSWNKKFWFVTRETYNRKTTTTHRQQQGSQLLGTDSVDTSTGEDLNVRAAGKGGSLDKKDIASTAVPGSLYGQQGIQVQLGSDGRYEGARIDGGEGSVVMHSAGSLVLPQATDQAEQQSRQLDGNAWAKVGNRPGSTGVDGRGYLDHGQKLSTQSKAQVAQIDAKGEVQLTSTGDLLLEGTRIGNREAKAGDIRVQSGGQLQVKAASNTQQATGANLGGGMELAAKAGQTQGGAIGGHFSHGKQDEHARQAVDAQFASNGTLTLTSSAREDIALHLQGLQASAEQITLDASNGGMLVEASSSQERRDNLDISAGAGFNMAKGALDTRGLHGRLKVELDKRDNLTWNTSDLRAERIDLQSRGDTRIESATLDAGHIGGTIDGDLRIASLKDNVNTLSVKGDVRLSQEKNPQGYVNAAKSVAGPLGGKVETKAGSALSKADPGFSPTVSLDVSHAQRDNVARQTMLKSSDGIDLQVGGNAHLVGARLQSAKGDVRLDANSVTQETLSGNDYRRDLSLDASNSPVDLGTAIAEIAKSKMAADGENALDLGVLRTSGHSRSEQWVSSMQGKKH